MSQTCLVRCTVGAALMSAVVGGLAYAAAERRFDEREIEFRQIAEEECLANDPTPLLNADIKTLDDAEARLRRLNTLHKVCSFAMGNTQ